MSWKIALAIVLTACVFGCASRESQEPIPVLGTLPTFALVDQEGRPFGATDLDGRVWIADFFFTRCATICPVLNAQLKNLARHIDSPKLGTLSIDVDPDHDTPEVLRGYAERFGADARRWRFLTGSRADVEALVTHGFRVRMGEVPTTPTTDLFDIAHATHFVLLDGQRRVRGYYANEPEALEKLERDARRLIDELP